MLDLDLLYNKTTWVAEKLTRRGFFLNINQLQEQNNLRKILQKNIEELYIKKKTISKTIETSESKKENILSLRKTSQLLKNKIISLKSEIKILQNNIYQHCLSIPNIPDDQIPSGFKEKDNLEIIRWGNLQHHDFHPIDHLQLGKQINGIDLLNAVKITGTRFAIIKGKIAHLHRALSQFMIDLHTKNHGYEEYYLPYLVNKASLYGSGQLPKFYVDLFHTESTLKTSQINSYTLIPTAEVPLINLMRNVILNENELPIKMVSHTPCFRAEAGTYGHRDQGLIRTHQFDKVELVQIVHPDQSNQALEEITMHAEKVLQLLKLPYRKVLLCAGNISFASCKTYDLEVWLPAHNSYCEISSCSNTKDFQARRIKARFKSTKSNKSIKLLHTLNASGVAVGRALVAVLENYQLKDGRIAIPSVLQPYMNEDYLY